MERENAIELARNNTWGRNGHEVATELSATYNNRSEYHISSGI